MNRIAIVGHIDHRRTTLHHATTQMLSEESEIIGGRCIEIINIADLDEENVQQARGLNIKELSGPKLFKFTSNILIEPEVFNPPMTRRERRKLARKKN